MCLFTFSSYATAQEIAVNFIANASLRITDGEHVIFTDFPYLSGAFGHIIYTYPYFVEQNKDVTTLITNRFNDHLDPEKILTLDMAFISPWLYENARRADALPNTKKLKNDQHKENEIIPNCFTCAISERGDFIPFE